jgi:methanethiol S-methyltransferase
VIWNIDNSIIRMILYVFFFFGWMLIVLSSFAIDHFDFFGVRQVYLYWKGEPYTPVPFKVVSFYKYIRHPMMLGTVLAFWSTPTMTVGHMVFSSVFAVYMVIGLHFEERDLVNYFGETYIKYQKNTPMIVPFLKRRSI